MNGIERLDTMLNQELNSALIKIVSYLKEKSGLNEDIYLNEEKSLKEMYNYISSKAKEQATNGTAIIEDSVVYDWATNYWLMTNEELGISKKIVPKINYETKTKEIATNETPKIEQQQMEFIF